ncbi:aspartyl/asparaginyl beta-hydroxylase domain-containing protein [Qipengyuania sp. YG27]|uniref:Aspartyl/asparaginyl beta-hydroxylase domain-containing protein n=1 Tax=Qipengyuania mesophila TaxID=2867246 RepID=A0ABS7JXE3_9SPHN|nr:aspartyl/asparaginyl beta-hydroxylase domain-containing protein [Qipengyuania mesophila]MBX7502325.1 aspartyl/asparaginyl beta-hydroxylase domain-containing protein [Qipengyuania mesophila]
MRPWLRSRRGRSYEIASDFIKLESDILACCRLALAAPELNAAANLRNLPKKPDNARLGGRNRHKWALRLPDRGDRDILRRWPEMTAFLEAFPGECIYAHVAEMLPSAKLGIHRDGVDAQGKVQEHYDLFNATLRFHLPLQTSDNVHVYSDGQLYNMRVGEVWMLDNMKPHALVNDDASVVRLHLIFDVVPNAEALALIAQADASLGSADLERIAHFWTERQAA